MVLGSDLLSGLCQLPLEVNHILRSVDSDGGGVTGHLVASLSLPEIEKPLSPYHSLMGLSQRVEIVVALLVFDV